MLHLARPSGCYDTSFDFLAGPQCRCSTRMPQNPLPAGHRAERTMPSASSQKQTPVSHNAKITDERLMDPSPAQVSFYCFASRRLKNPQRNDATTHPPNEATL